jgi:TolA-binding protein
MNNTERVIKYLDGELHTTEVLEFEEVLNTNEGLREKLELVNSIEKCLKNREAENFRRTLTVVHNDFVKSNASSNSAKVISLNTRKVVYWAAASIAILFACISGWLYFSAYSTNPCQQIFSEYYEPYQMDIPTRSDGSIVNNLQMAFQAYESKEYNKAVSFFDVVLSTDNSMLIAYFYKGVSCIEIEDYTTALQSFQKVIDYPSNPYYIQAKWYSALTWLKVNKPENAKEHLKWLVLNDRYYGEKAKIIIKQLK